MVGPRAVARCQLVVSWAAGAGSAEAADAEIAVAGDGRPV